MNELKEIKDELRKFKEDFEKRDEVRLKQIEEMYESLLDICDRILALEIQESSLERKDEYGLTILERIEKIEKRLDMKPIKKESGVTLVDEYGFYKNL